MTGLGLAGYWRGGKVDASALCGNPGRELIREGLLSGFLAFMRLSGGLAGARECSTIHP